MKIPCLHPLSTLIQLVRGALPLPLPKFKTLGYMLGHLNGVTSLVWEAKEVLGCGSCMSRGLALVWSSFPSSESLQSELWGIFLFGFGDLGCFGSITGILSLSVSLAILILCLEQIDYLIFLLLWDMYKDSWV